MTGRLDNKVIIVAGLGGIGNGLARRYADEGALLVIGDLAELAPRVAGDLDATGQRVRGVHLDGADEESVFSIVELAVGSFGRLDGILRRGANGHSSWRHRRPGHPPRPSMLWIACRDRCTEWR